MTNRTNTFIQIHTLTGYAGVLLNRDDAGMAKRIPYGDGVRTRVSSQSVKRKIRLAEGANSISLVGDISVRSRETFRREVALKLIEQGLPRDLVIDTTIAVMDRVYAPSAKALTARKKTEAEIKAGTADRIDLLDRGEINVLSLSEIAYIRGLVAELVGADDPKAALAARIADKQFSANLKAVGQSMSLDIAMFGRMVTGDALSRVDASVHVAHALTTHAQAVETDFFTAVDDLVTGEADHGGGHLGEVELTSPLLYGYYVVDTDKLLDNLAGLDNAAEVAAAMCGNLVRLVAENVAGAKKGSTAPYSTADLVMVEVGSRQPRTLAEAFRRSVRPTLEASVEAMAAYLEGKDRMYGSADRRMVAASVATAPALGVPGSLQDIVDVLSAPVAGK